MSNRNYNRGFVDMAVGEFVMYWRGQAACNFDMISEQEFIKAWKYYFRPKLIRQIKATPRFLGMGKDMPKTDREVSQVWLSHGDNAMEGLYG